MPEPRYASEDWRWIRVPVDDDPDNCRHQLVAGEGPLPGPRMVLECGNIDAEDMDGIRALPAMWRALEDVRCWIEGAATMVDLEDLGDRGLGGLLGKVCVALAIAYREDNPDA